MVKAIFLSACLAIPSLAQSPDPKDEEIIRVNSSLVVVNATITDQEGNSVTGLSAADFEIYEDGVRQSIEIFKAQDTPMATVILIDTSGSMEQRVSMARAAAIKFLQNIRFEDHVAIYNFDSTVSLVQDFSNLRDLTFRAFDLKAHGWTVLNDAVFKAADELALREEVRKAIVVLSDGADTRSRKSARAALRQAQKCHATIYAVDMSAVNTGGKARAQNRGVLKDFAVKTGGRFIKTPGGAKMYGAFEEIIAELSNQYTIGYYPSDGKMDGKWRDIELKPATKRNFNVRARKGYNAAKK